MRRELLPTLLIAGLAAAAAEVGPPQQPAGNTSPTNQTPATPHDPAAVTFSTEAGTVLHAVKADRVADYEAAMLTLREALQQATDQQTQALARGWRIYKAAEADAKSNVIYIHWFDPALPGVDYRPSLWLDKLLAGAPAELLAKYRDAFAVPPTKLSLTELRKRVPD